MNGLCLASICGFVEIIVRVCKKGRSGLQNKIRAVLIYAIKLLKFIERTTQSEHQPCRAGEREPR